jgi:hypothetical protein
MHDLDISVRSIPIEKLKNDYLFDTFEIFSIRVLQSLGVSSMLFVELVDFITNYSIKHNVPYFAEIENIREIFSNLDNGMKLRSRVFKIIIENEFIKVLSPEFW